MRIHKLTLAANIDLPTQVAMVMMLGICAGCDHSFNRCFLVKGDTHVHIGTRDAALARVDRVAVRWGFNAESPADVAFEGNLRHYNLPNTGRGRFITLWAREERGGVRLCLGEFLAGRETPLFKSIWGELEAERPVTTDPMGMAMPSEPETESGAMPYYNGTKFIVLDQ